ncbi:MAG: hypothetical protein V1668_01100 [Patescibacteria group bacterium]
MEDIPVFTSSQVDDQELKTWQQAAQDVFEFHLRKEALLLSPAIGQRLPIASRGDQNIYQQLLKLKGQLDFIALPLLSNRDVTAIIRDRLDDVLMADIDLWEQLRFKLMTMVPEDRDGYKTEIKTAMEQCQRPMSALPRIHPDGTKEPSTLANWLKDFRGFMEGKMTDTLRSTEFFTKNVSFRSLPEPDQEKLKMLFTIYQWLYHSTYDIEGYEGSMTIKDKDGSLKIFENGAFTTVRPAAKKFPDMRRVAAEPRTSVFTEQPVAKDPLLSLKQKYQTYRSNRQRILDLEDKVLVNTKGEPQAIYHELSEAVQTGDKFRSIACLKLLARQKALAESLKANPAWWAATAEYITKKYTRRWPVPEVKLAVSDLKYDPTTPAVISEFLQFILESRLRISRSESALIGVEIGQMTGGEYQSMAYGNAETGEFEWVKNKIADRKLVSET